MFDKIQEAATYIKNQYGERPDIGLILGSGLGILAEEIDQSIKIPYEEIPHFPVSTVEGHTGQLVLGNLNGKKVIAMQGRFHFYEGYDFQEVTFPVRVMKSLGVDQMIVTNAAGGVNENFQPGDLMIITDHINHMGGNPLIGSNDARLGPRFPDMSEAYSKKLIDLAKETAKKQGISVQEGIYFGNTGPLYETPAEVRMIRKLGGDAVGMSTVPEVVVARHTGIEVMGISCISNLAAGMLDQPLTHEEVIETTQKVRADFLRFVKSLVEAM
ncbi:purine-nucleoside phosphorylase [Lederbergia lenta]|uniref:Purine nucleoside phosphorylase n=1 Tax=Lederbergia lenta TaxID=1467 RepID=A0A2X4VWN9_LEDLE|nr:purine-nucleoside phosphorylase [Lederbergia lenta]MCM3111563.1 purine-nucleoside phosphorylase [Lederbergia lenta]MEC2325049.1 purine-nucleoside phosphorylase [Lederbergia lenta]SQI56456.1 purine nucleoside phosphorylase [Lederbergia lenta]